MTSNLLTVNYLFGLTFRFRLDTKVKKFIQSSDVGLSIEAIEVENKELSAQIGILRAELANITGNTNESSLNLATTMNSRPNFSSKKVAAASQELDAALVEYNQLVNRINQIKDPMYMLALSEKKGKIMQQTIKEKRSTNRLRRMTDIERRDLYAIEQGIKNPEALQETFDKKLEISRCQQKLEALKIKNRAFAREKEIKEEKEKELLELLHNLNNIEIFYCGGNISTDEVSQLEKETLDFVEYSKNIDETKKKYMKAQVERDIESLLVRNKQDRYHFVRLEEMAKEQRIIMQEMIETAKMGYSNEVKAILEKTDFDEMILNEDIPHKAVPVTIEVAEEEEEDINIAEADMKGFYTPTSAAFTEELSCEVKRLEQEYINGDQKVMKGKEVNENVRLNSLRKMRSSTELMKNRVLIRKVDMKVDKIREVETKEKNKDKSRDSKDSPSQQDENLKGEILNKSQREEKELSRLSVDIKETRIGQELQMKPESLILENLSINKSEITDNESLTKNQTTEKEKQILNENKVIEVLELQKEERIPEKRLAEVFEKIQLLQQRVEKLEAPSEIHENKTESKVEKVVTEEMSTQKEVKKENECIQIIEKQENRVQEVTIEKVQENVEENKEADKDKAEITSEKAPEDIAQSVTFSKPKISSMGRSLKAGTIRFNEMKQEKKEEEEILSVTFTKPLVSTKSIKKEIIPKGESPSKQENEVENDREIKPEELKTEVENEDKKLKEPSHAVPLDRFDNEIKDNNADKLDFIETEKKEEVEEVQQKVEETKFKIIEETKPRKDNAPQNHIQEEKDVILDKAENKVKEDEKKEAVYVDKTETKEINQEVSNKVAFEENMKIQISTEEKEIQTEVPYPDSAIVREIIKIVKETNTIESKIEIEKQEEVVFQNTENQSKQEIIPKEEFNKEKENQSVHKQAEEVQNEQETILKEEELQKKEEVQPTEEQVNEELLHDSPSSQVTLENKEENSEPKPVESSENEEAKIENESSLGEAFREVSYVYTEEITVIDAETQTDFPELPDEEVLADPITLPIPTFETKKSEVPIANEENVYAFGEISRVNRLRRGDKEIGTTNEPILEPKVEPENKNVQIRSRVQEKTQEVQQNETQEKMSAQIKGTERSATLIAYRKQSERNSALSKRGRILKPKLVSKGVDTVDVGFERKDEQSSVGISSSNWGESEYEDTSSLADSMLIRPLKVSIAVGTDDLLVPGGNLMSDLELGERKKSKFLTESFLRKAEEKLQV